MSPEKHAQQDLEQDCKDAKWELQHYIRENGLGYNS